MRISMNLYPKYFDTIQDLMKILKQEVHLSLVMRKRVFGSFRPGQTQTGLRSYSS